MIAYIPEEEAYNEGEIVDKLQEEPFGVLTSLLLCGFEGIIYQ